MPEVNEVNKASRKNRNFAGRKRILLTKISLATKRRALLHVGLTRMEKDVSKSPDLVVNRNMDR